MEQVLVKEIDLARAIAKAIGDQNMPLVHDLSVKNLILNPKHAPGYISLLFVHIKKDEYKYLDQLINKIKSLNIYVSSKNILYFHVTIEMAELLCKRLKINQIDIIRALLFLSNINLLAGEIFQARLLKILDAPISEFSTEFIEKILLFVRQRPNQQLIVGLVKAYLRENKGQEVIELLHQAGISHNVVRKHLLVASPLGERLPLSLYFYPHEAPPLRRTVVVAGPLKSASAFSARILALTLNCPMFTSNIEPMGNLDVDFLMEYAARDVVIHTHSEPTVLTARLIADFHVSLLIPIRNIFDTLVSLKDRFEEISLQIHPEYQSFNEQLKYEYIYQRHFPTLFNFFVSWTRNMGECRDAIMISSAKINDDPILHLSKCLRRWDVPFSEQALGNVVKIVNKSNFQSNVNRRRGKKLPVDIGYDVIPGHLVDMARQTYNYYPDVNFSLFDHRHKK